MNKHITTATTLLLLSTAHTSAQDLTLNSPSATVNIQASLSETNGLTLSVSYAGNNIADITSMGLKMSDGTTLHTTGTPTTSLTRHQGVMTTHLGEWSEHNDDYNTLTITYAADNQLDVEIRAYDEGFAWRYTATRNTAVNVSQDLACLTMKKPLTYWSESGAESGYTERNSTSSFKSLCPLFATSNDLSISIAEAANPAIGSQAQLSVTNSTITFSQNASTRLSKLTMPWRVVMMSKTQHNLQHAKYIMRSLNTETTDNTDYIKPGKVLRSLEAGTDDFHTDSVKNVIDFAQKIGCQYVLLDAGWYGLGYSQEKNKLSVPTTPRETLDMTEVMNHATAKKHRHTALRQ